MANWNPPVVLVSKRFEVELQVKSCMVSVSHVRNDVEVDDGDFNVTDNVLIVPHPLWGAEYNFEMTCQFQEIELECGRESFVAIVDTDDDCFVHSASCPISEHVKFAKPIQLEATARNDSSTIITWQTEAKGWQSEVMKVKVEDIKSRQEIAGSTFNSQNQENKIEVKGLNEASDYSLFFVPGGSGVPDKAIGFTATLVMRKT